MKFLIDANLSPPLAGLLGAAGHDATCLRDLGLTLASDEFARLACGRSDPSEALVTGVVAIDGDVLLGGEIVRQLNYMF